MQSFNGLIASNCASTAIIGSAGLLNGKFTTMPHIKDHFAHYFKDGIYCDCDIVAGEKIITARGYAHYEFMMAVLARLELLESNPRLVKMTLILSKNQS
ncbi:hypothetical protein D1B31_08245 [Neobacillus notoginsengisoli]|uniref:DJ-1/PfpI domain-containing protein n=1 Tax=Neobacillus notoginsengisoli TaxID=1578198 RepID=A0A417YWD1_9BACI|nr:hypothetical protein D1B31_08245 [Neobacillus notoginsengisoli]